jgi:hypothetical protein
VQLAWSEWFLGEVERARRICDQASRDAIGSDHVATLIHARLMETLFVGYAHKADATRRAAEDLVRLGREHGMDLHAAVGEVYAIWARGRLTDPELWVSELAQRVGDYVAHGNRLFVPYFLGLRAELEAEARSADVGVTAARRNSTQPRPRESCPRRASLPNRRRHSPPSGRLHLRTLGRSCAGQALPIDRQARGSPHRPRPRAQRLFANAGDAGDRRGDGADASFGMGLLRAAKPISRSQRNGSFRPSSGPSRCDRLKPASRPIATDHARNAGRSLGPVPAAFPSRATAVSRPPHQRCCGGLRRGSREGRMDRR